MTLSMLSERDDWADKRTGDHALQLHKQPPGFLGRNEASNL